MDDTAIVQLLEDVARLADAGEAGEARAAGPDAPGGDRDVEGSDLLRDAFDVDTAARELLAQRAVIGGKRLAQRLIMLGDHVRGNLPVSHRTLPEPCAG